MAGARVAIDATLAVRAALGCFPFREREHVWALRAFARVGTDCLFTLWTRFGPAGHACCASIAIANTIYT